MKCPVCGFRDTKVIDSRIAQDGLNIRRRRECEKCSYRFSTIEEAELLDITVVKSDGRRESYQREKLVAGLKHALGKRSYTDSAFRTLINKIERDLQKKRKKEIKSVEIGEIAMKHLKNFDKIGYIRFASVYRAFEDVTSFQKEIKNLAYASKKKRSKT